MQNLLKLTYFQAPGRAEPIRLLFHIGDIKFEDERLTGQEFGKAKAEGKFKYGQVPVLEIGGKQFAQSQGMIYYAAIKSGLFPKDPFQIIQIEQVSQNFNEIINSMSPSGQIKDEEKKKAAREALARDVIPQWLQRIELALVENGSTGFVSGKELTYGDILLFCNVDAYKSGQIDYIPINLADSYTQIQKVYQNVAQHPKVKDWYAKNPVKL